MDLIVSQLKMVVEDLRRSSLDLGNLIRILQEYEISNEPAVKGKEAVDRMLVVYGNLLERLQDDLERQ